MDALAYRIRDRFLIERAVHQLYTTDTRVAAWAPPEPVVKAVVYGFWEPRVGSTDRQAFLGIARAVKRLLDLFKRAPRAWEAIKEGLGLGDLEGLGWTDKAKLLGAKLKELATAGRKALGKVLKGVTTTFPLSLFFVPANKAPGLTDLVARILQKSPRIRALLEKIHGGAEKVDALFKRYIPRLSRVLYSAIFIWVWMNVAELSWDVEGILAGFTGRISLGELLASLPESGVGAIAASFGLGYGALPYALVARLIWLVVNRYIEWAPGKGFKVRWDLMGVQERPELVPAF